MFQRSMIAVALSCPVRVEYLSGLGKISFGAREKLESLGYEIITGFDLNESYYLISWEKEEN